MNKPEFSSLFFKRFRSLFNGEDWIRFHQSLFIIFTARTTGKLKTKRSVRQVLKATGNLGWFRGENRYDFWRSFSRYSCRYYNPFHGNLPMQLRKKKNNTKLASVPFPYWQKLNIGHILCVSWLTSSGFTIPTFFTSHTKFLLCMWTDCLNN